MLALSKLRDAAHIRTSCTGAAWLRPSLPGRVQGHDLVFLSSARNPSTQLLFTSSLRYFTLFL
jgi:hypothetical protein